MPSTSDHAQQLRSAALRVTRPRVAVLEAVHDNPHSDTETIFGVVRFFFDDVATHTIYTLLKPLTLLILMRPM